MMTDEKALQEMMELGQSTEGDVCCAARVTRTREMVGRAIPIQVGRAILQQICKEAGV